jgi:copper chaperone CopZ
MARIQFKVTKMTCGHCQNRVQKAIENVKGVSCAVVDLAGAQATVDYDPITTNVDAIKKAVVDAGYDV